MADASKISPYNLADCKNTTDDALQNYLKSLRFKQSHYLTDVKLALGYSAFIVCAITFAYDYKFGFEATKYYTVGTVIIYFLLNSAFTYWLWFVEKDVVFEGETKGEKVVISSWTKKLDPHYRLKIRHQSPGAGSGAEQEVHAPFTKWFTADGVFVAQPFQQWLASSVPVVGEADPKNAETSKSSEASSKSTSLAANEGGSSKKRK